MKKAIIAFTALLVVSMSFGEYTQASTKTKKSNDKVTQTKKTKAYKKKKNHKTVKLYDKGDFQFDIVNIKPFELKFNGKNKANFSFDWRNDNGASEKSSFNGSGVVIQLFQDGKELKDNYEELLDNTTSDLYFKIKKNTSLTIGFDYKLLNEKSDITVKMTPLEGESKEFTIKL